MKKLAIVPALLLSASVSATQHSDAFEMMSGGGMLKEMACISFAQTADALTDMSLDAEQTLKSGASEELKGDLETVKEAADVLAQSYIDMYTYYNCSE